MTRPLRICLWIAIGAVMLATISLTMRENARLANNPLTEDAYYALTVARNIAQGRSVTIDGTTLTNGFQPLFTFLCVPIYALFGKDDYLPLRLVLLLEWCFYVGTAWLVARIVTDLIPPGRSEDKVFVFRLTFLLYLGSMFVVVEHFNGLETGCVLFFYGLTWRVYEKSDLSEIRDLVKLGVLLGFTVLARIDAAFFVAVLALFQLVGGPSTAIRDKLTRFAVLSIVPLLVSLPWWLYNLIWFGTLMPTSGQALTLWDPSLSRAGAGLLAVSQCSIPAVYVGRFELINGTIRLDMLRGLILGAALVGAISYLRCAGREWSLLGTGRLQLKQTINFSGCFLAFNATLVLWYVGSSAAAHFYVRYFAPLMVLSTWILGSCLAAVQVTKSRRFARIVGPASLVFIFPVILMTSMWHTGWGSLGNPMYTQQIPLVLRLVPETDYVAAGQSGTLGYFRSKVVNLDGKVNSEALRYQDHMRDYLAERKIRWFCDRLSIVHQYLGPNPEADGWELRGEEGGFLLYHFKGSSDTVLQ